MERFCSHPHKFLAILSLFAVTYISFFSNVQAKTYNDEVAVKIEFQSYFGNDAWGSKGEVITAHGYLFMPKFASAKNKVPLAILLPGKGGQRGRDNRLCEELLNNGIACFGIRTYLSRGVPHKTKASKKMEIASVGARTHDAYSALKHFSKESYVDSEKIWLIGFSLGGFVSTLALDSHFTKNFNDNENDFAGFISMYGPCPNINNGRFKKTTFYHFIGTGDANFSEKDCHRLMSQLRDNGVNANQTVFNKTFNKIGHAWDIMEAKSSDWFGKPEGPWEVRKNGWHWPQKEIGIYGCGLKFDFKNQTLILSDKQISKPSDNDGLKLIMENCKLRSGVLRSDHKVTKEVDKAIINLIKNQ